MLSSLSTPTQLLIVYRVLNLVLSSLSVLSSLLSSFLGAILGRLYDMIHTRLPCTYTNFFSDAQLEDENPNQHPTRRALVSCIRLSPKNTLPFTPSRATAEEDAFGDDEASDDDDYDDEFWDCEPKTKHSSLRVHRDSQLKPVDRFAILACLDANPHRIRSSTELPLHEDQDDTSDYSESDFSAYTASEGVESPSSLATSQGLGTEATAAPKVYFDDMCVATHPMTGELQSIVLSENEDTGISSDDDSLFAQYGALLPSDKIPEKYRRSHFKPTKRVSPLSNTRSSIPRGCYRVVDFLHKNNFSEVVVAQSEKKKDSGSKTGRLCCIKIYRNGWPLALREGIRPELKAETKAYQRLSEAIKTKRPGFEFLMQLQALVHDEIQTYLVMDVMNYPLRAVIDDQPWALNRVQETRRLVAQMSLGLGALHNVGIIHRDFKPENVLIDYRGNIRITDFGSSKISEECMTYLPGGSYAHAYVGTYPYIAPEVLENKEQNPYGIEADYWSLGCIVFELESVYGESMFDDRSQFDLWCSLEDLVDKRNYLQFGELPPRALDLICGLLHLDVDKRFGLYEIIHHPYFGKNENSEFYYAQDRALRRVKEEIDVSCLCMDDTSDEIRLLYI